MIKTKMEREGRTVMSRIILLSLLMVLVPAFTVIAASDDPGKEPKEQEAKELSGMSIVGNDEAPTSLYIVPWKSSELGVESSLNMLLDDRLNPVDKEVFLRQLSYYTVSTQQSDPGSIELAQKY